jgi:hypothetical protein
MTDDLPFDLPGVVERPPAALRENPRNARTHSKRQIKLIADSIAAFGFTSPVLVDETGMVLAGHGRLAAARRLGLAKVPTLCLANLSEPQKRAYVLADNRLAERAGWDRSLLAVELGELAILLPTLELDWSIEVAGFETGDIEALTHDQAESPAAPEDTVPVRLIGPSSVGKVMFGCLATTAFCAATPVAEVTSNGLWPARSPIWSSPTLPTMWPSPAMLNVRAKGRIGSLPWLPVR